MQNCILSILTGYEKVDCKGKLHYASLSPEMYITSIFIYFSLISPERVYSFSSIYFTVQ